MENLQINDIPGFQQLWDEAIEEVYQKLADKEDGPHKIAITATIERKGVRMSGEEIIAAMATLQVKGPSPSKLTSQVVELIRENGTLKAMPQKQPDLGLNP